MRVLRVLQDWRGNESLQKISIESLNKGGRFYTLSPPLDGVRKPQFWNMEVASEEKSTQRKLGLRSTLGEIIHIEVE